MNFDTAVAACSFCSFCFSATTSSFFLRTYYSNNKMAYISADGTVGGKPTLMKQVFNFFAGE